MRKHTFTLILIVVLSMLTSCIHEDDFPIKVPPSQGAVLTLLSNDNIDKGDPAEPYQFWIELSTGNVTKTHREIWDLGFYSGDEFRVILNSSLAMAVGKIENAYDIDAVNSQTVKDLKKVVKVADFKDNAQYIDNPNGDLTNQTTGIAGINQDDSQNNVYLLNMGYKVYDGDAAPGTVYNVGEARGWKKIRILKEGSDYKIQYAELDETSHKEFIISKDSEYNYRFFSMSTGNYVDVQPKKKNWDLCYTVFTNLTWNPSENFYTSYIFPDVMLHNILGGAGAYELVTAEGQGETAYNNFKIDDVDASKFVFNDQRAIGSNWRNTTSTDGAIVYPNKFYVVKNSDGLYFKLRFLRMKDDNNYRGYPQFEYKPL